MDVFVVTATTDQCEHIVGIFLLEKSAKDVVKRIEKNDPLLIPIVTKYSIGSISNFAREWVHGTSVDDRT